MDINSDFAEFFGIMLGDGCLSVFQNQGRTRYIIRIDGNSKTDLSFFVHIQELIFKITGRKTKIRKRKDCNGIFISMHNKKLVIKLNKDFGFPIGKKKDMRIPESILNYPKLKKCLLRGFFDTDGCIYFTKNNTNKRHYPCIDLTTVDQTLLNQLRKVLNQLNFNIKNLKSNRSIRIYGKENINKWMNEIGSNNPDKLSKYLFWKKYGYCPKSNELEMKERINKVGPAKFEFTTSCLLSEHIHTEYASYKTYAPTTRT
tara:strand:- start:1122 stop:1895 length:774 start_codon:yes stop_codon:yes gene_type:complete